MTTIVYRDGVLAGDGRETAEADKGSTIVVRDNDVKVFKLPDGSLFGASDGSEDIVRLHEALMKGNPAPKLEHVTGLRIDLNRRIWLYEGNVWQRIRASYYAIGTGSLFAFPALDAGASATKACKIGSYRDPYSGGTITSVRLRK